MNEESIAKYNVTDDEDQIINQALQILERRLKSRRISDEQIQSPAAAGNYLKLMLAGEQREHFACLFMDNRHRLLKAEVLFHGSIDVANIHTREVVKRALQLNAAAIIVGHNHPSGVAEPSKADIEITKRLKDALDLVQVRLLDHFILGEDEPMSMSKNNLF
jgi:DNA repair protein RadC